MLINSGFTWIYTNTKMNNFLIEKLIGLRILDELSLIK